MKSSWLSFNFRIRFPTQSNPFSQWIGFEVENPSFWPKTVRLVLPHSLLLPRHERRAILFCLALFVVEWEGKGGGGGLLEVKVNNCFGFLFVLFLRIKLKRSNTNNHPIQISWCYPTHAILRGSRMWETSSDLQQLAKSKFLIPYSAPFESVAVTRNSSNFPSAKPFFLLFVVYPFLFIYLNNQLGFIGFGLVQYK